MQFACVTLILATIYTIDATDNRQAMAEKAVNLGVTFYTAAELETIFECVDGDIYDDPDDTDAIISSCKSCIISNSGSKVTSALSLLSNMNSCLSPDDTISLAMRIATPFKKINKKLLNKTTKALKKCKSAGTSQEKCIQKMYAIVKAMVTKNYVDKVCKKLVKQQLNSTSYNCGVKYAPSVADISSYGCSSMTIS